MHHLGKLLLAALSLWSGYFSILEGKSLEEQKKSKMFGDLDAIKHTLEVHYAPANWKKSYASWDLDQSLAQAKSDVLKQEGITTKQFQSIVRKFLGTTKDYHVQVYFLSTEMATLPFEVKSANGKYFVVWVDTDLLSSKRYQIAIGDELISFGGRPVAEVVKELKAETGLFSNPQTDQALAEMSLTYRYGMKGDLVPKGPISLEFKSAGTGANYIYQLIWDYQPELIGSASDMPWFAGFAEKFLDPFTKEKLRDKSNMLNPIYTLYDAELADRPIGIGTKLSYVPILGDIVWEDKESSFFHSYIYQNEQGHSIGYVRIPHYSIGNSQAQDFADLISHFQEHTDALVIDQLHNYGGWVMYQYALLSNLTDRPLTTPKHRISLTQENIILAVYHLSILENLDNNEDVQEIFGDEGFLRDYQYSLFLKEYYRFIIEEWSKGHTLTDPIYIEGTDYINPHPTSRYTKPILVLIDHLDFSGGDFFPAILQDNKRASLFGTRTAGAGGYVARASFPNSNGIAGFTYTASIAERINHKPIENLGVVPDIEYQLTEADLQQGYIFYAAAVNRAIQNLLQGANQKK